MLAHPIIPEVLISPCLDLLRRASQDDAAFIAGTLEAIQAISQSPALGAGTKVSNEVLQARYQCAGERRGKAQMCAASCCPSRHFDNQALLLGLAEWMKNDSQIYFVKLSRVHIKSHIFLQFRNDGELLFSFLISQTLELLAINGPMTSPSY